MKKSKRKKSPFQIHRELWKDCEECPLCETRKSVVLAKGRIPADILFIGEAPGESEDILGLPFVGPAGKLLSSLIESAEEEAGLREPPTKAFTNLVACIPRDDDRKTTEPPKESILACRPRLVEMIEMVKPRLVIYLGKLSEKHGAKTLSQLSAFADVPTVPLTHPAAILRAGPEKKGLMLQSFVAILADVLEEVFDAS